MTPPNPPGPRPQPARLPRALRELGLDLLALLWPCSCVACGAPDRDCCDACLAELRAARGVAIWVRAPAGVEVCVAGAYADPLRALLVACKHDGRTGFARPLGERLRAPLAEALRRARGPSPPRIVAAPSRPARVRERGFRHVELLVRAALPGRPERTLLLPSALQALPGRDAQVGLGSAGRRSNAALVRVRPGAARLLRGREVVLVDDIVTTGATIEGASRALAAVGARVVGVAALCAVERRDGARPRDAVERRDAAASAARGPDAATRGGVRPVGWSRTPGER